MQKDTWPPKPSLPDQAMSSVKDVSPGQEASSSWVFLFIPGAVVGAILYLLTGYLVIQSALRSINVGHLGILALLLLCNSVPFAMFFSLRRKILYMAWGFLSGSLLVSVLLFLYTLRMWFLPGPYYHPAL